MVPRTNEKYFVDTLTFEQVGDLAWEIGENSLEAWVNEFNRYTTEHASSINSTLGDFSILYGVAKPNRSIIVDLHHNPIERNTNGGPKTNLNGLEDRFPVINAMGDFMYRLPNYFGKSVPLVSEQTVKLLHEAEHSFFQGEEFNNMVAFVMEKPDVKEKLIRMSSEGGLSFRDYANEPVELITTYLENIVYLQGNRPDDGSEPPFVFRADKNLQGALIEIEATLDRENPNGPSAKYIEAWKRVLEKKLSGSSEVSLDAAGSNPSVSEDSPKPRYNDVYELGRALNPALAFEYLKSKKSIDEDFIFRLVSLAEKEVFS